MVGDTFSEKGASGDLSLASNLVWPLPGRILKDSVLKEKIWDQIQTDLIPAFLASPGAPEISLDLSSEQIKRILLMISDGSAPFTFKLNNNLRVGVNLPEKETASVDVSLDAADLASMLTAAWVFGASRIELPKGYDATRDKPY